tara:strand:- start:10306 stop:10548 length:243 start_codon:yes stop_codon:yes gene_type:complete
MDKHINLPEVWTIRVKRSVLEAAIKLEDEFGDAALWVADSRMGRDQEQHEQVLANEVWRYLMAKECVGINDTAEIVILPE